MAKRKMQCLLGVGNYHFKSDEMFSFLKIKHENYRPVPRNPSLFLRPSEISLRIVDEDDR